MFPRAEKEDRSPKDKRESFGAAACDPLRRSSKEASLVILA